MEVTYMIYKKVTFIILYMGFYRIINMIYIYYSSFINALDKLYLYKIIIISVLILFHIHFSSTKYILLPYPM